MGARRPYANFEKVEGTDRHIKRGAARAGMECNVKKNPASRDLSLEESVEFYGALGPADVCTTLSDRL